MDKPVEYIKFWPRAGAQIIDSIAIALITSIVNIYNLSSIKSFSIYLTIALLSILYKPFMEYKFAATLGKMVLNIKVVNQNFEKIDFLTSLKRSAIFIIPNLFYIPFYYLAFRNPKIIEVNGILEFSKFFSSEYPLQGVIAFVSFGLILADIIVLLSDSSKKEVSLHDRIGMTYVIKE
jgi:uncharacterized RDD family membrane protein YckC